MASLAQAPDNTVSGLLSNITGTTAEWAGGGAVVRAAIVASVLVTIRLIALSPVLLIVFLLSLIITAIHRAMRARHH